jgi:hypothetical protein
MMLEGPNGPAVSLEAGGEPAGTDTSLSCWPASAANAIDAKELAKINRIGTTAMNLGLMMDHPVHIGDTMP